ncbi:DUF3626 domain-containing protein [Paenibacillus sp. ACRRX]|uniref:DUF3626 domain-containing protein n=1 Tax=Paenibacillus sp. ACRRX TaxID=2918206 RepID=UPI001EF5DE94|nr:DUF3626 domain-containing protein [Paenibacillus sp. ACRRX]MCG7410857.1 DUF3626 domain-containing protein [Paenibacillus sp. ACRRX]
MDESLSQSTSSLTTLTAAQVLALNHVKSSAMLMRCHVRESAERILVRTGVITVTIDDLMSGIGMHARVTLNFHPDRILPSGLTVVEGLLRDGAYHSQFVTGVSNGSRTAFPGGDRDRWEEKLFGGVYQSDGVRDYERPKYGALNLMNYVDGASPRFGSCYLRLRPHILSRCTFTFGDSHTDSKHVGTIDIFDTVLAELLGNTDITREALGSPNTDVPKLVKHLLKLHEVTLDDACAVLGRSLDDYIETQVHGDIKMSRDVEALVADSSYKETPIGDQLETLCSKYNVNLAWHPGFRLSAQTVPDDFRGPAMPPLAERVSRGFAIRPGELDAVTLGRAAATLHFNPESWQDWGTPNETSQHLKQLWHILVRYGQPI